MIENEWLNGQMNEEPNEGLHYYSNNSTHFNEVDYYCILTVQAFE